MFTLQIQHNTTVLEVMVKTSKLYHNFSDNLQLVDGSGFMVLITHTDDIKQTERLID